MHSNKRCNEYKFNKKYKERNEQLQMLGWKAKVKKRQPEQDDKKATIFIKEIYTKSISDRKQKLEQNTDQLSEENDITWVITSEVIALVPVKLWKGPWQDDIVNKCLQIDSEELVKA